MKYTVRVDVHIQGIAIEAGDEKEAMQKVLRLIDEAIQEPLEYSLGPRRAEALDVSDDGETVYVRDLEGDLVAYERLRGRDRE